MVSCWENGMSPRIKHTCWLLHAFLAMAPEHARQRVGPFVHQSSNVVLMIYPYQAPGMNSKLENPQKVVVKCSRILYA